MVDIDFFWWEVGRGKLLGESFCFQIEKVYCSLAHLSLSGWKKPLLFSVIQINCFYYMILNEAYPEYFLKKQIMTISILFPKIFLILNLIV